MITKEQIKNLSQLFLIDEFTILREYLQLVFLSYLYQRKEAKKIFFKGGTAIRLLFNSPRFSEDLDFSTFFNKKQIIMLVNQLEKTIQKEIPYFDIFLLYPGKETTRFRIKYQSENFKYPLVIRLDFHHVKKIKKTTVSPLVSQYPILIFPLINHLTKEAILEEKIQALLTRGKGRDFFDVWYLLEKGGLIKKEVNKQLLIKKIKDVSLFNLKKDLSSFLPRSERKMIMLLKERLLAYFS